MKKILILKVIILNFLIFPGNIFSQPSEPMPTPYPAYDVYTPKGHQVNDVLYFVEEMSPDWFSYWNGYYLGPYPNVTVIEYSTVYYNCHGYAWHYVEGLSKRWIGGYTTSAEDLYWSDYAAPSYKLTSSTEAIKKYHIAPLISQTIQL
ncbi:hypothetical protein ES705_24841 [subsurface metagenome]